MHSTGTCLVTSQQIIVIIIRPIIGLIGLFRKDYVDQDA